MIWITSAQHLDNYRILLGFSNGEEGTVDLSEDLWGPAFEPLKDLDYFKQVALNPNTDTIAWPNGADFAPEFLYKKAFPSFTSIP